MAWQSLVVLLPRHPPAARRRRGCSASCWRPVRHCAIATSTKKSGTLAAVLNCSVLSAGNVLMLFKASVQGRPAAQSHGSVPQDGGAAGGTAGVAPQHSGSSSADSGRKCCKDCGRNWPMRLFPTATQSPDGRHSLCYACRAKRYSERRPKKPRGSRCCGSSGSNTRRGASAAIYGFGLAAAHCQW